MKTTMLALEQISVRLGTVKEYGDIAANVEPAMQAINKIYGGFSEIVPETDQSMLKLNDLLENVLIDATQHTEIALGGVYASEDGNEILREASSITEEKLSKTLPNAPNVKDKRETQGI